MTSVETVAANWNWLCTGRDIFPAMLAAIEAAERSVRLETYTYAAGPLGEKFRDALIRARQRGVRVQVLIDALGSVELSASFWKPLQEAGGEVRRFNPLALIRLWIRNHRKSLVCDERVAFVGGFNIAKEYEGDGVTCGWCDLGLKVLGPLAGELARAFDEMFARADFRQKLFHLPRLFSAKKTVIAPREKLLLSGPGRGRNPIKTSLRRDLERARDVRIMVAYFLPSWRIRRELARIARSGGRVQLLLAGKSDVWVSQLAARSLYRSLLQAGVEIYEYQPQILHAKLIIIDDIVYAGSANLDPRSLNLNYELMVRFENREVAAQGREVFRATLAHGRRILPEEWRKSRTIWQRLNQYWAYLLLARLDPYIAQRQWKGMRD